MAENVILSNCQLQVWRPNSSKKSLALTDLELSFCPDGDQITVKQFSELDPSDSFVAYELKTSNCRYLSTEYLSADVKIICLLLNEPVIAAICVDDKTSPEAIADEVATLEICPMADTRLPTGCKVDLIISTESLHESSISRLLELFGDGPKKEKSISDRVQFPTVIQKDKTQSTSITLSNDDLEYLEASAKPSLAKLTKPKVTHNRSGQNRGPRQDSSLQFIPTGTSCATKGMENEKALVDNWNKKKEMWEQISARKPRQNRTTARLAALDPRAEAIKESKIEWVGFAASNASPADNQGTATYQGGRTLGGSVSDPRETGGYPQDPNRHHNRPDSQQFPIRITPANRGYRGRYRHKAASFIPPTNTSMRPQPRE